MENKWYHWGRWIDQVLSTSLWLALDTTGVYTKLGIPYVNIAKKLDGNYFFLKEELKDISDFIESRITDDKSWFDTLFSACDTAAVRILALEDKDDVEEFFSVSAEFLNTSFVIGFADYGVERYLEKLSEKTGIAVGDVLAQVKPHKKTPFMEYQEELRSLKEEDILAFVKKYKWMGTHMFMHSGLTEAKVREELEDVSREEHQSASRIELPDEYKEIVAIGSRLTFYRSYLVEIFNMVSYTYRPFLKNLAKEHGLTWDDLLLFTYKEVIALKNEKVIPKDYNERKDGFGMINVNNEIKVVTGEELKKELDECQERIDTKSITELKGMAACRGKVTGVVKIVEEAQHISKLKKGEILVANETTPDYIIGMKIAGAIITNQGGITSHAAIISRELNVPCIIGTKIATKVLKDGDLVEVDANKGVVKIIDKR